VLGVLSATQGTYQGGKLVLIGVNPQPTWFTDRPARAAGTLDVPSLLDTFFKRQSPPNAAVVIDGAPASDDVAVVELKDPQYDAKAGTVAFAATLITQIDAARLAEHPSLAQFRARNDGALPAAFGASSMFLDSAPDTTLTPDEQKIQGLLDEVNTLVYNWETLRFSMEEHRGNDLNPGHACYNEWLDINTFVSGTYMTVIPQIKSLQAKVVAQNGVMNGGDLGTFNSYQANVQSGQNDYSQEDFDWTYPQQFDPPKNANSPPEYKCMS